MVFVETPVFTRRLLETLQDDDYANLQQSLASQPDAGYLVPGGAGIRKLRWLLPGRGKRGGVRVIYFWRVRFDQIVMLYLFVKGERSDLTPAQIRHLAAVARELK